ncbi:hypothetical protein [Micromonospora sp. CB01531]|uniref:hypothetical protein n=1 Tax=Micromonospora sp. CB01531 TaxID=1718947 RepID=UPI00095ADBAC|nr:hypothetical protein [Micromonospora sp. CB01531]OKI61688.1 hypothetical protein A6A27_27840 [Micromonospora sp. CB01531]
MLAQQLTSMEAYHDAPRRGRGEGLRATQREPVWTMIDTVVRELAKRRLRTGGSPPTSPVPPPASTRWPPQPSSRRPRPSSRSTGTPTGRTAKRAREQLDDVEQLFGSRLRSISATGS